MGQSQTNFSCGRRVAARFATHYLDKACEGDLSLRAAVESLIKSHEETTNFVDVPAYEAAAEMLAGNHEFNSGHTIAHYQIRSVLGEGRMGKVYLAHDTKLDRKVVEDSAAGFSSQSGEHEALYAGS